jgi:putative RNA 2'-phosphotransferase
VPTNLVQLSKFLSLVLRHKPEVIGLALDESGWANVAELVRRATDNGQPLTRELVTQIVAESDKQRFVLSADGLRIRAIQGHSVKVDLALPRTVPPATLYHGTTTRFLASIRATGLNSGQRQHVHLSADEATATKVGQRHGKRRPFWSLTPPPCTPRVIPSTSPPTVSGSPIACRWRTSTFPWNNAGRLQFQGSCTRQACDDAYFNCAGSKARSESSKYR